jgi:uncharacterized protein (TIGR02611 family)
MSWGAIKSVLSLRIFPAPVRKLVIAVIGGTVLLLGIALLVLPGPAFLVIPIGLAILATEFAWARRAVVRTRAMVARARGRDPRPEHAAK